MFYLDHAAATPVAEKVQEAMLPYFAEQFFNPSAPYLPAVETRHAYEEAKERLAHTIGAKGADLVMTSGATEALLQKQQATDWQTFFILSHFCQLIFR